MEFVKGTMRLAAWGIVRGFLSHNGDNCGRFGMLLQRPSSSMERFRYLVTPKYVVENEWNDKGQLMSLEPIKLREFIFLRIVVHIFDLVPQDTVIVSVGRATSECSLRRRAVVTHGIGGPCLWIWCLNRSAVPPRPRLDGFVFMSLVVS